MGASEWGKPPNALRGKGVEKEEEEEEDSRGEISWLISKLSNGSSRMQKSS
jgi:hypothetical protein